ncbi:MAG: SRPBCC family protein [Candidatus Pacebacteria bacterium]|nr:SRPBCC family protein [Candidatus Paceibacterota bacterium]
MTAITVETTVHAPLDTVWSAWTEPEHITQWCFASDDWECPSATNDVSIGGSFSTRMAAKDGSAGFDFGGTYSAVALHEHLAYSMSDGRTVDITFTETPEGTHIIETFDPENENPEDMQRAGWQSILDNFKKHAESIAQ